MVIEIAAAASYCHRIVPSPVELLDDIHSSASVVASLPRQFIAHSAGDGFASALPIALQQHSGGALTTKLLVVGCAPYVLAHLHERLNRTHWCIRESRSGSEALEALLSEPFDLALIAPQLPDLDALEVRHLIEKQSPGTQVISLDLTDAQPGEPSPRMPDSLSHLLRAQLQTKKPDAPESVTALLAKSASELPQVQWQGLLGEGSAMQKVFRAARLVAPKETTVLIEGESGTGKDLLAHAIHKASPRAKQSFVVINCAAIPEALLEAELFGHTKGAFTGATQARIGRLHAAHGGTLFLDEIGDMPLPLQSKLLRFLEQGEVQRIGSTDVLRIDCRVIAATNAGLKAAVRAKQFREDLYYRLAVFPFSLPPLRERKEDIPALALSFLNRFASNALLHVDACTLLMTYDWPGNVRELRNVMERASLFADGRGEVLPDDITF